MAAKKQANRNDKRVQKAGKKGIGAKIINIGINFKTFAVNLKSELKRVVWPDRKRLVQNTATVLAICVMASILLFIVDSVFGGLLDVLGFYSPR